MYMLYNLIYIFYTLYTFCTHFIHILYTFYTHFTYFLYTFYIHLTYFLDTFWDTFWACSGQVWVEKNFFPESVGDVWGVFGRHHWCLRRGLEGLKNMFFSKKIIRTKNVQNHPLIILR